MLKNRPVRRCHLREDRHAHMAICMRMHMMGCLLEGASFLAMCLFTCLCMHLCMYLCMHLVYEHAYLHVYVHAHAHVHAHVHVHLHTCTCIWMCICMCMCSMDVTGSHVEGASSDAR